MFTQCQLMVGVCLSKEAGEVVFLKVEEDGEAEEAPCLDVADHLLAVAQADSPSSSTSKLGMPAALLEVLCLCHSSHKLLDPLHQNRPLLLRRLLPHLLRCRRT